MGFTWFLDAGAGMKLLSDVKFLIRRDALSKLGSASRSVATIPAAGDGTVQESEVSRSSCTAFLVIDSTLGTAPHCVTVE